MQQKQQDTPESGTKSYEINLRKLLNEKGFLKVKANNEIFVVDKNCHVFSNRVNKNNK